VTLRGQGRDPNTLRASDISVSKINLVSVTVLCVTGSFPFLLCFSFEIFSVTVSVVSFQIINISVSVSVLFPFQVLLY